ncbi:MULTISPECIES: hypothetical protein [Sphingomonas]|uniref:hypothetical protein n=1 Tax=Sphingomonas TaxID=13687 RepID=UPI00126A478C|nr:MULTISPECIES: hypothetical protein [Sphingomonas]
MIAAALLLSLAPVATAVDAERAFAADAQRIGQWSAFRKWADPTAVMFTPQATWAQSWLAGRPGKSRPNPPQAVRWSADRSFVSCDGRTAVNTGPWRGPNSSGTFTTLWLRQKSGAWRWTVDGGDEIARRGPLPARAVVRKASCANPQLRRKQVEAAYDAPLIRAQPPGDTGFTRAADGTLLYQWKVSPAGAREQVARLWNGTRFEIVLDQRIAAPPRR